MFFLSAIYWIFSVARLFEFVKEVGEENQFGVRTFSHWYTLLNALLLINVSPVFSSAISLI
jgi:hypothetical protein